MCDFKSLDDYDVWCVLMSESCVRHHYGMENVFLNKAESLKVDEGEEVEKRRIKLAVSATIGVWDGGRE